LHRYPEYNLFTLNETNTKRNAFAVKRGRFAFYTRFIFNYSSFVSFVPYALKGQKPLAQGIALGNYGRKPVAL